MKKRIIIFFLFFPVGLILFIPSYSNALNKAGEVLIVKKDVFRIRGTKSDLARPMMELLVEDAVRTEKASRAKLYFIDDSILNLGEQSYLKISEYLYNPERKRSRSIYRLINGAVKVVVGRSDLEIHTQTAVAAARGTEFIIWSENGRETKAQRWSQTCVLTLRGQVELRLKEEAITPHTIRRNIIIGAGMMGCTEIDDIQEPFITPSRVRKEWESKFPVLASDIPVQKEELPAFAPEPEHKPHRPIVDLDEIVDPPIIHEPEVESIPELNIKVLFPKR